MTTVDSTEQERLRLYLGTGCGKTTATFGLAIRALAKGMNVSIVFFDKLEANSSEGKTLKLLSETSAPGFGKLEVHYTGINRISAGPGGSFRFYSSPNGILPEDKEEARRGLSLLKAAFERGDEIVIADEMLDVARVELVSWDEVKEVLNKRTDPTLLVLTGRKA
ncbi:MAG: cob(I)yrinic acid a,c-diamide adenosyltransferase, partial [Candidatus Obscuribacterales bacterium]|nr:cob(I)yrinic acid a,c-diamide adenosyltransferase [Candidatus Obscuribacterales bacterium]